MLADWALSAGTPCGGEGSWAALRDAATPAEHGKLCPKAHPVGAALGKAEPPAPESAPGCHGAAELISACNQQGMKGR